MLLQSAISFTGVLLLFQRTTTHTTSHRYHLFHDSMTWYEAQKFCRVKYHDLATVNNMVNKNELVKALGSHAANSWIGLIRGTTRRWMWADGRGRADFTLWDSGEPNGHGSDWCAEISQTGSWNDEPCGAKKDYVCYERHGNGPETYVHYSEQETWVRSLELCRSAHTDLACVSSKADNDGIADAAKSWTGLIFMPNKVWFGLFNDDWTWSDGRETSFRYWLSSSQDHGRCAAVSMTHQGRWVDANCNDKATFVCQGSLKVKKMIIRMVVHSDADLTDSKVSDAILAKFETGLKDRHLTDFSLAWRRYKSGVIFQRLEEWERAKKGAVY